MDQYITQFGIILFPITLYQLWTFTKSFYQLPLKTWILGIYGGLSAVLCQLLPLVLFGQPENFQCVPIILSILYGKRRAGLLSVGILIGYNVLTRPASSGLIWTIAGIVVYSAIPFIICWKFEKVDRAKRLMIAALLSIVTLVVELLFLVVYFMAVFGHEGLAKLSQYFHFLAAACAIQLVVMGFAFFLFEYIIENGRIRKRHESLIEYNPIGICAFDMQNRITAAKAAYQTITGYSEAELRGRSRLELWFEEDYGFAEEMLEHVRHGSIKQDMEASIRHKHGHKVAVRFTLVPMVEGESMVGYFGMVSDITESKMAEEVLRNSEKLSAIGQLAAGVAHEIRNPLTAIKGFIQLLSGTSSEADARYYDIMKSELSRLEGIISEMLVLAKPQAVTFQEVDVKETLEEVVNFQLAQANMQNVVIKMEDREDIPKLMGDSNQLKQVFLNLTKNAIEAMPDGGCMTIRLYREDDNAVVAFTDTGGGIPKDVLAKLGEPFLTTKEKGTGLGFLVSKRIVASHRGALDIRSVEGEGTTVSVILPIL